MLLWNTCQPFTSPHDSCTTKFYLSVNSQKVHLYKKKIAKLYASIEQWTCWKQSLLIFCKSLKQQANLKGKTRTLPSLMTWRWTNGPSKVLVPEEILHKHKRLLHIYFSPVCDLLFTGPLLTIPSLIDPLYQMLGPLKSGHHHAFRSVGWSKQTGQILKRWHWSIIDLPQAEYPDPPSLEDSSCLDLSASSVGKLG
jgi:hypothetical protein